MSHGLPADYIVAQLRQLEKAELVRQVPKQEQTYIFNHALTLESAYESLLLRERREIHHRVADAYEHLYPDRLDENASLLAHHCREAGDNAKAFAYSMRAGDAATRIFAYPEASAHYAQALEALARLPDTEAHRVDRVNTLLCYVSVSLRAQGPVATLKRLAGAERLARPLAERDGATREDRLRLARVRYWKGQALIHQNEMRAALKELRQVLQVAQADKDAVLLAMPASVIGRTLVTQGQFAQALPVLTDASQALEQVHDDQEWILATGFRGVALTMLGDCTSGIAEAQRALARATQSNTLSGIALAHGALGMSYFFGNDLPTSIVHARAMIDAAARSGDRLYAYTAYGFLAWADVHLHECDAADKDFAQAHAIAEQIGGQLLFADWFAAARAERALHCGRVDQAMTAAATVSQRAHRNGSLFAEGVAERIRGQAMARLSTPRLDGALVHLANSLARLQEGGAALEAARTRIALALVLKEQGETRTAREQLEQAGAQFRKSGMGEELEQVNRLIYSLPAEEIGERS